MRLAVRNRRVPRRSPSGPGHRALWCTWFISFFENALVRRVCRRFDMRIVRFIRST